MKFCKQLRHYRMQRMMGQKDVAAYLGVSLRAYQQYEQGLYEPRIDRLIMLADLFQISLDELVGRGTDPEDE